MTRLAPCLLVAFALSAPVEAQDIASADDPATATDAVALSVVERWEADRATLFDGAEIELADLRYVARPLVVFSDSPNDPMFIEQLELIADRVADLAVRDVILVTDADPDGRSDLRGTLRPRGFAMVLIDKDGRVIQRKPSPWSVREITHAIDKTPLRQQEIREGR